MEKRVSLGLVDFLNTSYSAFHAIENIRTELEKNGFTPLCEGEKWSIKKGGKYYVTRNDSSVMAFKVPVNDYKGFNIVASHSDSPCFKIKEKGEMVQAGEYISLNTEPYGGPIMSTWFDRPLSVAGRVMVKTENGFESRLVYVDKDLLIIPNLAIHMNRTVNTSNSINAQSDVLPLFGDMSRKDKFDEVIAETIGVAKEDIVAKDLFLCIRDKAKFVGLEGEYICGAKLDDLQCAYTSMDGFLNAEVGDSVAVLAVFDNEETGSSTKQGALSTLLSDTLMRMNKALGYDEEHYLCAVANSFMISADNAHSVHPNYASKADPTNRPFINKGVVVKHNANQSYTTDAVSNAIFKNLADKAGANVQHFTNRSDMGGGSTLGNLANHRISLNTVDIGLPQFAMHSCYETAGVNDTEDFAKICKVLYESTICKTPSGYEIK